VTCTHASNILGTIHDIKAIASAVHTIPGALLCVDAVAYAPHRQIDIKDLGVDFYSFSWYKVYGPHISILYASPKGLAAVTSQGHYFNKHASLEDKLGLAGSCYELTAAIPSILAYFGPDPAESWKAIEKHEFELQSTLLAYLNGRAEVTIQGEKDADTKKRVSTISFLVEGRKSQDVVESVDQVSGGEMGIRWGLFYSNRLAEEVVGLGKDGVVRVSMVHYNTRKFNMPDSFWLSADKRLVEEVKRLIGYFDEVLGRA
jgi:selenocysteine lyase/cysteine desulfurase